MQSVVLSIVSIAVLVLNIIKLKCYSEVVMLSIVMLKVIILSIIMLNVVLLRVIVLKINMLKVIILYCYAECFIAKYCYAGGHHSEHKRCCAKSHLA
jgi:hypothetical protein